MSQDIEALIKRLENNDDYGWIEPPIAREAAAALRAQQWQDIGTAPDYTRFLAWCPTTGICMMRKAGHESETWSLSGDVRHPEPTKWQPLPKAPQP